jgi:hypothetical protein
MLVIINTQIVNEGIYHAGIPKKKSNFFLLRECTSDTCSIQEFYFDSAWPKKCFVVRNIYFHCKKSCMHAMVNKKYHIVRTIPKSNFEIVEKDKIDSTNAQIHDHSLSWFGTCTSIKSGGGTKDRVTRTHSI